MSKVPLATTLLELAMSRYPKGECPAGSLRLAGIGVAGREIENAGTVTVNPPAPVNPDVASVPIVKPLVSIVSPPARRLSSVPENPLMKVGGVGRGSQNGIVEVGLARAGAAPQGLGVCNTPPPLMLSVPEPRGNVAQGRAGCRNDCAAILEY